MVTWSTITGKLSPKESKIVNEFVTKNNISKNELLLRSLQFYIPIMSGMKTFSNKDVPIAKDFQKEMDKIIKSKDYQIKTEKAIEKLTKKYGLNEVESHFMKLAEVEKLENELKTKHASRGRPKKERKRGRPKA